MAFVSSSRCLAREDVEGEKWVRADIARGTQVKAESPGR
jgi:hypothetical protein